MLGLQQHLVWNLALVITWHITVCMQKHSQLVGDNQDRVQNFQVVLLRHVVGDPLHVVGNPQRVLGDPQPVGKDRLV